MTQGDMTMKYVKVGKLRDLMSIGELISIPACEICGNESGLEFELGLTDVVICNHCTTLYIRED